MRYLLNMQAEQAQSAVNEQAFEEQLQQLKHSLNRTEEEKRALQVEASTFTASLTSAQVICS